jgi:hypothetical protein
MEEIQPTTDPLRGFKSFSWMEDALNPNKAAHPTAGAAHTMSSNVDGKEYLYPTVRANKEGTLQQYSPVDAQKLAIENDDFLSFDSPESATAWSKDFSEQIGNARRPVQIGTTQEQTKALNPNEIDARHQKFLDVAVSISNSEDSLDNMDSLLQQFGDEVNVFDPQTGYFAGIDPTVILKDFQEKFPDNDNTTEGAEILKDFLKKRINTQNYQKILQIAAGGTGRAGDEFGIDLVRMIGRAGHNIGSFVLGMGGQLLAEPMTAIGSLFTDRKEAEAWVNDVWRLSTYIDRPNAPKTFAGRAVEPIAEVALAFYTGGKALNGLGTIINKHNRFLKTALERARLNNPKTFAAVKTITQEVIGSPVHVSPENTLGVFLKEVGFDNDVVNFLIEQPDDDAFMRAYKNSLNALLPGTAIAGAGPIIAMVGRGLYNWNKPIAKEIVKQTDTFLGKMKHLRSKDRADRITDGLEDPNIQGALTDIQAAGKVQKETLAALKKVRSDDPKAVDKVLKKNNLLLVDGRLVPIVQKQSTIRPKDQKVVNEAIRKMIKDPDSLDLDKNTQEFLNVKRISSHDGRVNYINQLAKVMEDSYFKDVKTNPEIAEQAKRMQDELLALVGEDNLAAYYKNWANSTDQTPAMAGAIRQYLWQEGKLWKDSSDRIAEILNANKAPSPEEWADYYLDAYRYMGSLETDLKVASNISRTLSYRRHLIGAEEKTLLEVVRGAAESGKTGPEVLADLAKNVSKAEDLLQLKTQMKNETGSLYKFFHGNKMKAQNGLLSNLTTQAGATLGMTAWFLQTGLESGTKVGANALGRKWFDWTGSQFMGKGDGFTFNVLKAEQYGTAQAFIEPFLGKGYFDNSAIGLSLQTGRTLKTRSIGSVDDAMELSDTYSRSNMQGSEVKQMILGKEFTMAPGINAEMTKMFPELLNLEKNEVGKVMKTVFNGYGFIHSSAGRGLIMQDQAFRTLFESREMFKLAAIRAEKLVREELGENLAKTSKSDFNRMVTVMQEKVITNLPDDIAQEASKVAQVGLMQEALPKPLKYVERLRDHTSDIKAAKDAPLAEKISKNTQNIVVNLGKNFLSSKTNFMRTAVNIVNQQLYERGPLKPFKVFFNKEQRAKWNSGDPSFRQDVLAKTVSGSALLGLGMSLGNSYGESGNILYTKGMDSYDPSNFYLNQVEGTGSSEIFMKAEDGTVTSFSLLRIDPLNYSLMLGSILGSARQKYLEAMVEQVKLPDGSDGQLEQDSIDEFEAWDNKLFFALGHWLTQLPMVKPLKDTLESVAPAFSGRPNSSWDTRLAKELAQWGTYLNPLENGLTGIRKSLHKTFNPNKRYGPAYEDKVPHTLGENAAIRLKGSGKAIRDPRKMTFKEKDFFDKLIQEYQAKVESMTIIDTSNIKYPKVGQDVVAMVGPEGNLLRHLPGSSLDKLELGLKNILLPFYPKVAQRSVTMQLMMGLEIKGNGVGNQAWKDPRRWTNKHLGGKFSLNQNQRYAWAVYAGELNKESFNTPEYEQVIRNIENNKYDLVENMQEKMMHKMMIDTRLQINNEIAFTKMVNLEANVGLMQELKMQGWTETIRLKN